MTNKSKLSRAILYLSVLAFTTFLVSVLYMNQEVLYTAHDRSEFISGTPFFHTLMSKPFGLIQYVGAWLTQFCYHPILGAGIQVSIWILIFFLGCRAFKLQGSASALMLLPIACLLLSIVDLGYWIYIYTIRGYWFSQSVGYLIMLLLLWAARSTPRKWHLAWYLLGVCIYPLIGWFALLFIICLILSEKITWREFAGLILLIFTTSIWYTQLYSNLKFDDVVLAGLPCFEIPSDSSPHLSYPFWALGAISLLIPLCSKYLTKWFVPVLCAAASIFYTWSQMYYDQNYIDEMRMVRYAENDNWLQVLQLSEEKNELTNTMVFLKNIALMNEGGLLDRSFKIGNNAASIYNPDTLHVTLLDIASPLVYYNYGMINESTRLDFENAIQAGFSPFYLKILARCALATGDNKLVDRYTTMLHHMPFYEEWQPAPVTAKIKELQTCYPDEITGVENSDSYIVNSISLWSESDSKVASEQALFYAMIRCDSRRFWAALRNYVKLHMNEQFPVHAQEAYILYLDKAPEEKRMMMPVEQTTYDRYKRFWDTLKTVATPGMSIQQVGEQMYKEFGDTYWWYNIFGKKPIAIHGQIGNETHA
ncbi:MAG: DUF6057 family protein [Bacteroidaceae bacterium]|nr:DUF6057 family protein [Bacteroidaceae bacterium]